MIFIVRFFFAAAVSRGIQKILAASLENKKPGRKRLGWRMNPAKLFRGRGVGRCHGAGVRRRFVFVGGLFFSSLCIKGFLHFDGCLAIFSIRPAVEPAFAVVEE